MSERVRWRQLGTLVERGRLLRYATAGLVRALAHLGVLFLLVEQAGTPAVVGSSLGFVAAVVVAFSLQHHWVFRSHDPMSQTGPRFLIVTGVA